MINRTHQDMFSEWWWTVDRLMLVLVLVLIACGMVLSFAASPAVAERIGIDSLHFIKRHAIFVFPALLILISISFLNPDQVRRVAMLLLLVVIGLMIVTLFSGSEFKGARRWLYIAGFSIQPSEYLKPAFIVVTAWLFAENGRKPEIPGNLFSIVLFAIVAILLAVQPDIGQTALIGVVWGILFFLSGAPWLWMIMLGSGAVSLMITAYFIFPHVALRFDRFWTGEGDNFQVNTGYDAIVRGGWFGQGPGEGTVKKILPDAHADFAFAVMAEEFGIIICLFLAFLFAFIVLRGLRHAFHERDPYIRLSVSGLVLLFGMQSAINMAVNLNLVPAKGMTLPFISYGGSSMLSMAIIMGFVLALTRKRPESRQSQEIFFSVGGDNLGQIPAQTLRGTM